MIKGNKLSYIAVSDVHKARKFFSEVIGLTETTYDPTHQWVEMRGQETGAMLGICPGSEHHEAGAGAIITFTVDDLEKTLADFKKKGVHLIGEVMEVPGHVKMQLFVDADGNKFQIVQNLSEEKA